MTKYFMNKTLLKYINKYKINLSQRIEKQISLFQVL